MKILKKGGGSREKGEEETKSMPHAPVLEHGKSVLWSASVFVSSHLCKFVSPLCSVFFKAMEVIRWWCKFHLQSFYFVITYKIQLILYVYSELFIYSQNIPYFNWFNHTKWGNNKTSLPFTLFLRYSIDYIWSTMEQWRQYLCRFLYTYDFLWSPPLFLSNADSYKLSYL
jgi:hypothetical protein